MLPVLNQTYVPQHLIF